MKLVIDVGNTRIKYGLFNTKHQLLVTKSVSHQEIISSLQVLFESFSGITHSLLSATGQVHADLLNYLQSATQCCVFTSSTPVPITKDYQTPHTLGLDRIALAVAAHTNYPGENCLVVDVGTCITYDFIDDKAIYRGGAISPGMEMRFKAMHTFTAKLPLVIESEVLPISYMGKNTVDCLKIGVFEGIIHEMNGFIKQYHADNEHLTIVLTGGNAQLLADRVKNSIFANLNFQLMGLYQILIYNINVHQA